ncbi:MAG: hypothetical protein WCA15_03445 [Candidatus Acidiferrales bacterium]
MGASPPEAAANLCYITSMEITLSIPDEIAAQAKARGLAVDAYIQEILARQVAAQPSQLLPPRIPAEVRAWLDSVAQLSDRIPPLPEIISREWIYQEHD